MHQWFPLYTDSIVASFLKDTSSSTNDTSTHYQFLFSEFHKYRNWGGEGRSSQNERTLEGGGGGAWKQTRVNKAEGGVKNSGILSERTFWMFRYNSC